MKKEIVIALVVNSLLLSTGQAALVAHYALDETTGTTAADSSGNGHTGTVQSGANLDVDGVFNSAISFSGDGGVQAPALYSGNAPRTISAWFNATAVYEYNRITSSGSGAGAQFDVTLEPATGGTSIGLRYGNGNMFWSGLAENGSDIATDTWNHVAVTYDGTTLGAGITVYLNGTALVRDGGNNNNSGQALNTLDNYFWIGRDVSGTGRFNGVIDDVRVYDEELTAAEVTALADGYTPPSLPIIESFTANDYYVSTGTPVTIRWETSNTVTSLSIDQGIGDVTSISTAGDGSTNIVITATGTYTLTATNTEGSSTATLRIGAGEPRPNILVFLVDDMGWQDTSLPFLVDGGGNDITTPLNNRYRTPNMETLATKGMKFTNAYAMPVCTPSRCCLTTGNNSARHHITTWTHPAGNDVGGSASPDWRRFGMDATDITLPHLLSSAGYRSIHVGKAHFGSRSYFGSDPLNIGFDINIGGREIGQPGSYTGNYSNGYVPGLEEYHDTGTFLTEALTLEMNKAIEDSVNDGVPFFAHMSHYAVHAPFETDVRFSANYPALSGSELAFATMIEGMDKSLGDIIAKINALGVGEDTLVIFMSDNGGDAPIPNSLSNPIVSGNAPLRGKKGMRYEGGIRVPMIAAWASANATNPFQSILDIPADSLETDIVAIFDLFPTLMGVADVSFSHDIDGYDLRPYFAAIPGTHRPQKLTIHFPHDHNNDYFTIHRDGDWKLIYNYLADTTELYDLSSDLSEQTNLAASEPDRRMAMVRAMAQDLDKMGAQFCINISTSDPIPPVIPNLPAVDVDNDGVPDIDEDPNRNGLVDPGETDPDNDNTDGDKTPDGAEIRTGTDPLDPSSDFVGKWVFNGTGGFVATWPSAPGAFYEVQITDDLTEWSSPTIATDIPASDPGTNTSCTVPASPDPQRFYRIGLLL